jgi:hypothetical protein
MSDLPGAISDKTKEVVVTRLLREGLLKVVPKR